MGLVDTDRNPDADVAVNDDAADAMLMLQVMLV